MAFRHMWAQLGRMPGILLMLPVAVTCVFLPAPAIGLEPDEIKQAVVQIFAESVRPDYIYPWQVDYIDDGSGSGVIIGGNRILTAAHVVEYSRSIYVRKTGSDEQYQAELQYISDSSDLALLTVVDEEFFEGTKFIELGELPNLGDDVLTWGFPVGGTRLAITKGTISRIDMDTYAHSEASNLVCQIDAAINPGSSGGGAFINGKLAGITFQGISGDDVENLGYIIPTPVIKQFLKDTQDGQVHGVPVLGIYTQEMTNSQLREKWRMKPDMTGVLVILSHAKSVDGTDMIRPGDVILGVNGHSIGNDGTIPFLTGDRIDFYMQITQLQVGDVLPVRLLRNGEEMRMNVPVAYNWQNAQLEVPHHSDFVPDYEIVGGLVFQELSRDYINTSFKRNQEPDWMMDLYYSWKSQSLDANEAAVFLATILPDRINRGYEYFEDRRVESVNGTKVDSLGAFRQALSRNKGEFHSIVFHDDYGSIVLDRNFIEQREPFIAENYGL